MNINILLIHFINTIMGVCLSQENMLSLQTVKVEPKKCQLSEQEKCFQLVAETWNVYWSNKNPSFVARKDKNDTIHTFMTSEFNFMFKRLFLENLNIKDKNEDPLSLFLKYINIHPYAPSDFSYQEKVRKIVYDYKKMGLTTLDLARFGTTVVAMIHSHLRDSTLKNYWTIDHLNSWIEMYSGILRCACSNYEFPYINIQRIRRRKSLVFNQFDQNQNIQAENHIMISYSHHNMTIAKKIQSYIQKKLKKEVWIDSHILPGRNWRDAIAEAIETASHVIFIVDSKSTTSQYCKEEIFHAKHFNKPIIPIVTENIAWNQLTGGLRLILQHIQYVNIESQCFEKAMIQLRPLLENKNSVSLPSINYTQNLKELSLPKCHYALFICCDNTNKKDVDYAQNMIDEIFTPIKGIIIFHNLNMDKSFDQISKLIDQSVAIIFIATPTAGSNSKCVDKISYAYEQNIPIFTIVPPHSAVSKEDICKIYPSSLKMMLYTSKWLEWNIVSPVNSIADFNKCEIINTTHGILSYQIEILEFLMFIHGYSMFKHGISMNEIGPFLPLIIETL
jgi:hypothetical protein